MKKLAVLFPGIGYTCEKPLLYYTASLASGSGYEILRLDYGKDIHSFRGRNMEEMETLANKALSAILPELQTVRTEDYDDIIMISKSIGTLIACMAEKEMGWRVRHFLMTPIPATLPWLETVEGIFVVGTDDPFTDAALILDAVNKYPAKLGAVFEGCDHSLEKRNGPFYNLENIKKVLNCLDGMLLK